MLRTLLICPLITCIACMPIRYTVPGREILQAQPKSPVMTIQTDRETRIELIESVSLENFGPEWNLPRQRAQLFAQARQHPDDAFVLVTDHTDSKPIGCGIAGALLGGLIGMFIGTHGAQSDLEALSDGLGGFSLGMMGGGALGSILCSVVGNPAQPAHLVP
jgi:hypothetical protein